MSSAPAGNTERLDSQLRGRAGRQGDPGSSVFFSSWEDEVVVANLENRSCPTECDETGRITSPKANALLDHAQRVAEVGCSTSTRTPGATTS